MRKRLAAVWLVVCLAFSLTGCYQLFELNDDLTVPYVPEEVTKAETIASGEEEAISSEEPETVPFSEAVTETEPFAQTYAPPEDEPLPSSVEKDGSYTTPEDVAEYIHTFGTLPENFITKREAMTLGWLSSEGNLWEVAPGKSIGGDNFGNREGLLPEGRYHECDVNYEGGFRGSERLIYGEDGGIWYTGDHYVSFEQLY